MVGVAMRVLACSVGMCRFLSVLCCGSDSLCVCLAGRCIEFFTRDIRITPVYLPTGVSDVLLVTCDQPFAFAAYLLMHLCLRR